MLPLVLLTSASLAADHRAELAAAFADPAQHAAHLVLVDVGGTPPSQLGDLWSSLAALERALPAGDSLGILAFSDKATELLPQTAITEEGREALAQTIAALAPAPGRYSDLGAGLAAAARALQQPGILDERLLIVYSDLCHEPPPDSPYAFPGVSGCSAIRGSGDIQSAFEAQRVDHELIPVALSPPGVDRDGRRALSRLVGDARSLVVQADQPSAWVSVYAEAVPWRILEARVRREVSHFALSAEVTGIDAEHVNLNVHSGLTHLQASVSSLRFSKPELKPVKTHIDLEPDGAVSLQVLPPEPPFSLVPRVRHLVFEGELTGNAAFEPKLGLSALGVHAGAGQLRVPLRVNWAQRYGPPIWAFALACSAPVLLLGVLLRRRLRRSRAQDPDA